MLRKKIWTNFQRIIELLTEKIVTKLSKIGVWDPGPRSWFLDPENTIPGPRPSGQKSTRSRIRIRNTSYWVPQG
jgi:hypothetical protein